MNETNTTIGGKIALFNRIRKSGQTIPLSKAIIHTTIITCLGLIVGVLIKLFDFTQQTLEISFRRCPFGFLFAH